MFGTERLAHRGCNTKKGAVAPVAWPKELFVADAASIITSVERLARKRGSEAMGRCPTEADAKAAAEWLVDRLSRLAPGLHVESKIQGRRRAVPGGAHVISRGCGNVVGLLLSAKIGPLSLSKAIAPAIALFI